MRCPFALIRRIYGGYILYTLESTNFRHLSLSRILHKPVIVKKIKSLSRSLTDSRKHWGKQAWSLWLALPEVTCDFDRSKTLTLTILSMCTSESCSRDNLGLTVTPAITNGKTVCRWAAINCLAVLVSGNAGQSSLHLKSTSAKTFNATSF